MEAILWSSVSFRVVIKETPFLLAICLTYQVFLLKAWLNHSVEAPGLHERFEAATEIENPDAWLLAQKG